MKFIERSREYISKFKIPVILVIIVGFIFVIVKSGTFVISNGYLQLEMKYLILSILRNHLLVTFFVVSAIISNFFILSTIKRSKEYIDRLKIAVTWSITLGFIFGTLVSITFIISNGYLELKMYYVIAYSASSILNKYLLASLGTTLFVFVTLPTIQAFLNFIGMSRKAGNIIVSGIVPSLLIFAVVGYWINKRYLPGFFELKSVIGNAIWALICVVLVWVVGWLVFKISQTRFNFSPKILKLYSIKSLFGILSLVILLNVVHYFYLLPLKADSPNLILISIDTLRADHLSGYGYSRNTTPNFDQFAKDGVLFTNTIAQASWTLPSHMSLLTGLYSSSHGVMVPTTKLNDGHLTLAEILQNAGYKTVAFTEGGYVGHQFNYQGFDRFDDTGGRGIETLYIKAFNWLRKDHSRPFFLFLHTYQVHCPYDPPPDYDIYSDKNYRGIVEVSKSCAREYGILKPKMTTKDYLYVIDKYDGEIYYTDHFLGELFKKLKDLGVYNKSIIVLTSDHGENFLDHQKCVICHSQLYDEVVKVPLIIKAPMLPKNQTIDAQVEGIDIMPTLLELLGIPIPNRVDGESLVELVKKGSYDKIFAFSENSFNGLSYKMVRTNDWKLFRISEDKLELYDLKRDPKEQHNLFGKEGEIAKSLFERLHTWMDTQEEKSKVFPPDKIQFDDELNEKLKALGYIN